MDGFLLATDAQNALQSVLDDFRRRADEITSGVNASTSDLMNRADEFRRGLAAPPPVTSAAPAPGFGYNPSALQPTTAPPDLPLRQDVRDLAPAPQPTLFEPGGPIGNLLGQIGEAPGLSEADRAARRQMLEQSPLGQAYGSPLRQELMPNILEPTHPLSVLADLQEKYGTSREPMSPEDEQRLNDARMFIGGMAGTGSAKAPRISSAIADDVADFLRQGAQAATTSADELLGATTKTRGQHVAEWISSNLLSGPPGLIWNTATGLGNAAWQPILRVAEGHPVEALDAVKATLSAVPEAARLANRMWTTGALDDTSAAIGAHLPGLRANLAGDAFSRLLNERMGGLLEAQKLIRQGGATTLEEAQKIVAANSDQIAAAAAKEGQNAALLTGKARTAPVQWLSDLKTDLLRDPNGAKQVAGVLLHTAMPFARVPEEVLYRSIRNAPVLGQIMDAYGVSRGTMTRSRAIANGIVNAGILGAVLNGNVRGPDDPDHPDQAQVGGVWLPLSTLGPIGGRMALTAALVDAINDERNQVDPDYLGATLNAAGKFAGSEWPLSDGLNLVSMLARGQTSAIVPRVLSNALGGMVPISGALGTVENVIDPYAREAKRQGPAGVYEPVMARIPGAASLLPTRVDVTTGEPLQKASSGAGALVRAQNADRPIVAELARLNRLGYVGDEDRPIKPPSGDLPKERTVYGVKIPLSTAQAQQIQAARGRTLAAYGRVLGTPAYEKMNDLQKALYWQQALHNASQVGNVTADMVALQTPDLGDEIRRRRRTAGMLDTELRRQRQRAMDAEQTDLPLVGPLERWRQERAAEFSRGLRG